jgi:broad specificity phosphatase PhoE
MAVEIIYETHATTTDNEAGIATGWLPGELSTLGRDQARELGHRRRADDIAVMISSDLTRAVQTAEIAFAGTGLPLRQDPRLRECDYGSLNGAPSEQLAPIRASHIHEPFPGGQSYQDVVAQTRELLAELARDWDDRTVLLIGHSANLWSLQYLFAGADLADLVSAPFDWQPGWRYTLPTGWPQSR